MPRWSTWKPRAVTAAGCLSSSTLCRWMIEDSTSRYATFGSTARRGGRMADDMVSPGISRRFSPFCYCPSWHLAAAVLRAVYALAVMAPSASGRFCLSGCQWGWSGVSRTGWYHLLPWGLLSRVGEHAATTCARPQRQVSIKNIERVLQLGFDVLAIQRQLMQPLPQASQYQTMPSCSPATRGRSMTRPSVSGGRMGDGCEGIDNRYFALFHLSNLGLASGIAMLHIDRALELIENFVVRIDMEIIASIRSFDNHENEVGMPKDFFIPY